VRPPASRAQRRNRRVEPALVDVDGDHDRPLSGHDVGGGAADAARRRGDDYDPVGKAHGFLISFACFARHSG
jgi:hypothetical protein